MLFFIDNNLYILADNSIPISSKFFNYKEVGGNVVVVITTRNAWSGFSCLPHEFPDMAVNAIRMVYRNLLVSGCPGEAKEFKEIYNGFLGVLETEPIFTLPAYLKV